MQNCQVIEKAKDFRFHEMKRFLDFNGYNVDVEFDITSAMKVITLWCL